jgi:hypothetical protein
MAPRGFSWGAGLAEPNVRHQIWFPRKGRNDRYGEAPRDLCHAASNRHGCGPAGTLAGLEGAPRRDVRPYAGLVISTLLAAAAMLGIWWYFVAAALESMAGQWHVGHFVISVDGLWKRQTTVKTGPIGSAIIVLARPEKVSGNGGDPDPSVSKEGSGPPGASRQARFRKAKDGKVSVGRQIRQERKRGLGVAEEPGLQVRWHVKPLSPEAPVAATRR